MVRFVASVFGALFVVLCIAASAAVPIAAIYVVAHFVMKAW